MPQDLPQVNDMQINLEGCSRNIGSSRLKPHFIVTYNLKYSPKAIKA